jgi:catechol 2,3-dioxygenase-like lactoylglutathione lyase family enzyme
MPAQSLNHYTIRVRDLEATKNFYTDVVGLTVGDRPPLAFPGYWLYCGDVPTVHLIGHRAEDAPIDDAPSDPAKTGRLDHIAFACEGLKDMKANLEQHGIKFDERVLPRLNMTQLFYYDPDGIAVECNFAAHETEGRVGTGY